MFETLEAKKTPAKWRGIAIRRQRNVQGKAIGRIAVATGETVYVGSLLTVLTTTGRAHALAAAAANHRFLGVCEKGGTGDASGTVFCEYSYGHEVLVDANTTITTADIGRDALLSDDNFVDSTAVGTSGVRIPVGEVTNIESGDAWIWLRKYCGSSAAV